jgi:hypothetical protein
MQKVMRNGHSIVVNALIWRRLKLSTSLLWSRDSSVGKATGYGLDDQRDGVRVPIGTRFSPLHNVHASPRAHQVSYPKGTVGSLPGGKAAGT